MTLITASHLKKNLLYRTPATLHKQVPSGNSSYLSHLSWTVTRLIGVLIIDYSANTTDDCANNSAIGSGTA